MTTGGGAPGQEPPSGFSGLPPDASDPERWQRVRTRFEEVVERGEDEWPELVAAAPEDERELLARLLAADRATEPLLDFSPDELASDLFPGDEPLPEQIGPYRVLGLLGRGGMGQVLRARRDDLPGAGEVAIKLLRRGMDSGDVLRRFRAERKILGHLAHPNIARLLDGGITEDGRPYVVMECVLGSPITTHCEEHGLSVEARLRLFLDACAAVEHAHERGIVHRDLKPRNIVVGGGCASPEESLPKGGTVKLLDFGIAKALEPGGMELTVAHTRTGSRFMTLEYASPEQIRGGALGPPSDVYSLGVVLHELLTGRRPHDLAGLAFSEAERIICERRPPRPTREGEGLPRALQAIVLMALRKEPERRYASAGPLGDDIRRLLGGEPVRARGDSVPYRVRTFVRRRAVALALLVAGIGLAAGVGGVLLSRGGLPPLAAGGAGMENLTIAVLPFEYSGPEDQAYFADGLVEAIRAQLAGLWGLTVVSPGGMGRQEASSRPAREVASELGVGYLLSGVTELVANDGASGRIVVEARLLEAANDSVVWAQAFDLEMEQFLDVQSVIASFVGQALGLTGGDMAWAARGTAGTTDPEAYRFYLRGNDFIRFNEDEERLRLAEASYRAALARDSTFGDAWARLSTVHTQLWFHRYDPSEERREWGREAAERALQNHPDLPESYYALAYHQYQGRGDLRQAQRYFEQTLELQPNHVRALFGLASVLRRQGRMEEALARFQELTVLEPTDANYVFSVAFTQQLLRNYPESERIYAEVMRRASDLPMLYFARAHLALARTGSVTEARRVLAEGGGAAVDNDHTRSLDAGLGLMAGRYQEVLATTERWGKEVLDAQTLFVPVAWLRAAAFRGLGEADSARVQEAIALGILEDRILAHPDDARAHGTLGRVYATLGRPEEAVRAAERGKELTPLLRDAVLAPFRMEDLAAVHLLNGALDDAMAEVESILAVPGVLSPGHLRADPLWAPLLGRTLPGGGAPAFLTASGGP